LNVKHFGSTCPLKDDENFIKDIIKKTGIVEAVINWFEHKQDAKLQKQSGSKTSKLNILRRIYDRCAITDIEYFGPVFCDGVKIQKKETIIYSISLKF
jgi:hypothetical protein